MSLFGFNRRPAYRKFDFIPRFYDPAKEELEDRLKNYDEEDDKIELARARIKSGLRTKYRVDTNYQSQVRRKSNIKLFVIVAVLVALTAVLLNSNFMQRFIASLI